MALTKEQRKRKLGRGAARKIAAAVSRSESHVSRVLSGERLDAVVTEEAARRLGVSTRVAFPEYYRRRVA